MSAMVIVAHQTCEKMSMIIFCVSIISTQDLWCVLRNRPIEML